MANHSFFSELRERKVVQAAAIYVAVAWGVTEIVITIVEQLFLPQWVSTLAVIFFVVGFPIAMFLSWTFDLTAEGIQRTEIASGRGRASIALSMMLLVAGTAGLFLLIRPALDRHAPPNDFVAIAPNSVAVLPFDYATSNPDDRHLGPALSDELRDQLARVTGLRIAARSSSIAAVQERADAKVTARKLGVVHLLEGNMRRQGGVLLVSVQLIDGASGLAIWTNTFERGRRELLNLQQEIAEAVVREVLPGTDTVVAEPATRVANANELMLLARHYEQQVRERPDVDFELLAKAIQLYRDATKADPESALAYSRLAGALMYYGDIDAAEAPAYRALELGPRLPEAQNTYGKFLFARGRPNMGEPLARAVELNPNLPDALHDYAFWYWLNKGDDKPRVLYERALEFDQLNVSRYSALGQFLAVNADYAEARELIKRMEAMFESPEAFRAIAHVYSLVGDVDHSIAWTIKARDTDPNNTDHIEKLAEYYVDIGEFETAEALTPVLGVGLLYKMRRFDEMIDKAEERIFDFPDDIRLKVHLASAYSIRGRHDQAINLINRSGIIDTYPNGKRAAFDMEAYQVLINATYGRGDVGKAREIVSWSREIFEFRGVTPNVAVSLQNGCEDAILGNDAEVRYWLDHALNGLQLVRDPVLKDFPCYKRFTEDPAYQAVVEYFDGHREMLRERLPITLAHYGVAL